ncbi:MAG: helix-turn-helix domain-containing protein [Eubacteriales bacterium]|nr:helix-turn-helix domain-containing protein [Eubacteriales bacterium]
MPEHVTHKPSAHKAALELGLTQDILEAALSAGDAACLIFDADQHLLYQPDTQAETIRLADAARGLLVSGVLKADKHVCGIHDCGHFLLQTGTRHVSAHVHTFSKASVLYYIFHISDSKVPASYARYGILALDRLQAEAACEEQFFGSKELMQEIFADICPPDVHIEGRLTAGNLSPDDNVLIAGEIGTGRDTLAQYLYLRSSYADRPLYLINCRLLSEKSRQFLFGSERSPLSDNRQSIYFANLNTLSRDRQKELLAYILGTNLHIRNRLLFSCEKKTDGKLPHAAMEYANMLGLSILPVQPLRMDRTRIPALAEKCMAALRPKQDASAASFFSKEAAGLLASFDWPYNLTQLKRVVKETGNAQKMPVSAEAVRAALSKETGFSGQTASAAAPLYAMDIQVDHHKTLEEISREIALYVLKEYGGNQTRAAKSLGISRTTLWRLAKSAEQTNPSPAQDPHAPEHEAP